jgi:hypothetical protein
MSDDVGKGVGLQALGDALVGGGRDRDRPASRDVRAPPQQRCRAGSHWCRRRSCNSVITAVRAAVLRFMRWQPGLGLRPRARPSPLRWKSRGSRSTGAWRASRPLSEASWWVASDLQFAAKGDGTARCYVSEHLSSRVHEQDDSNGYTELSIGGGRQTWAAMACARSVRERAISGSATFTAAGIIPAIRFPAGGRRTELLARIQRSTRPCNTAVERHLH